MAVYYIDLINGNAFSDGFDPENPRLIYKDLDLKGGDFVFFKRGTHIRDFLETKEGEDNAPITYGAFGEGEKPVFCGSVDVSGADAWTEIEDNIWMCIKNIPTAAGNFVYDHGKTCGALRWNMQDLSEQGDFYDNRFGCRETEQIYGEQYVCIYSKMNPGLFYTHIECVVFGKRSLAGLKNNIVIENISFENSGVHGCVGSGNNITVRGCDFKFIGGCVWSKSLKIRYGNGVEFWDEAYNVSVENCLFYNIYDSGVTHQGGERCKTAVNVTFKNNIFIACGMAAYEGRDIMPINACFHNNICIDAGTGFSNLGDTIPRSSEIWPQPMGHHVFLWRIPKATANGRLEIKGNIFYNAPFGAAIYSLIAIEAEKQMVIDENVYDTENQELLNHFGGQDFNDFHTYQTVTGQDARGQYKNIDIHEILKNCGRTIDGM